MGSMHLTDSQKKEFYGEGWLKISGAVPKVMVDAARRSINNGLGQGMRHPFGEINGTQAITDMFNKTSISSLLESALGEGNLQEQRNGAIKLNFPATVGAPHRELNVLLRS